MFRFIVWLARRLGSGHDAGQASSAQLAPGQLITVRLADGSAAGGAAVLAAGAEDGTGNGAQGSFEQQNPTIVLVGQPGGPQPPRRSWFSRIPRWLRWTAAIVIVGLFFRRIVAWAVIGALSAALHLFGANVHLPHITFGWPWSSPASSSVLVGPLVLQKIEGIDKPALGTTTFSFLFTHSVSKPMGFLPCWYSATFYAVGHASATVNLNPGPSWWKRSTGHYVLRVLSRPSGGAPGKVSITMALPLPQLPQSVHDVSVDDTISKPVSSDHSWTYPGLACGVLIKPQFAQSVLYSQAQTVAFQKATQVKSVTQPLIAAAEKEATTIIGGNFITPTLNALNYKVSSFTIRWVAPGAGSGATG
ncbi:MAG TPA: hypothetical protein VMI73_30525 [Trebonia sp.]|nr:hypothetical protein [Trebonia sp.]